MRAMRIDVSPSPPPNINMEASRPHPQDGNDLTFLLLRIPRVLHRDRLRDQSPS
jgi:hypothetical protein